MSKDTVNISFSKSYLPYIIGGAVLGVGVLVFVNRKWIAKIPFQFTLEPVWDAMSNKIIESLHPELRAIASKVVNEAQKKHGMKLRVTEGLRTIDYQNKLYGKGRTAAQLRAARVNPEYSDTSVSKKTKAKGGQSYHNYGLAFDIVEVKPMYGYKKGYPQDRWNKIAAIAKKYGLTWGGDWKGFADKPHFQLTKGTWQELLGKVNSGKVDKKGYVIV